MTTTITSEVLVAYSQCPRKAFLLLFSDEKGIPHEYISILDQQRRVNQSQHINKLKQEGRDIHPHAVDYLKNRLAERISQHAPHDAWAQYEITLIGHSMGSIVLNEWVRRNDEDGLYYKNIVYMAAACSIRDYEESALTFMTRPEHQTTQLYHLVLHYAAELRDRIKYLRERELVVA